jgi:hypothetical protein
VYGKVKLYFPDQAQYGEISSDALAALDAEAKVGKDQDPPSPTTVCRLPLPPPLLNRHWCHPSLPVQEAEAANKEVQARKQALENRKWPITQTPRARAHTARTHTHTHTHTHTTPFAPTAHVTPTHSMSCPWCPGLRILNSALTEEELAARLAAREAEVAQLRARLEKLQSTVTRPVAPHAREELTKKINKYKVSWVWMCSGRTPCLPSWQLLVPPLALALSPPPPPPLHPHTLTRTLSAARPPAVPAVFLCHPNAEGVGGPSTIGHGRPGQRGRG